MSEKVHSRRCENCDGSGFVYDLRGEDEDNCPCIYDQASRCTACQTATTWEQ